MNMPVQKYHLSMRILHWLMAILIVAMIIVGFVMKTLPNEDPLRMTVYNFHKSFGILILILVTVRIILRLSTNIPPLPQTMAKLIQWAAKGGHLMLYFLMIAIPISGYLMSSYYGFAVKFFNIFLPNLVGFDPKFGRLFEKAHYYLAFLLIAVLVVHIAAVIKHRFFDQKENDIWPRMT